MNGSCSGLVSWAAAPAPPGAAEIWGRAGESQDARNAARNGRGKGRGQGEARPEAVLLSRRQVVLIAAPGCEQRVALQALRFPLDQRGVLTCHSSTMTTSDKEKMCTIFIKISHLGGLRAVVLT